MSENKTYILKYPILHTEPYKGLTFKVRYVGKDDTDEDCYKVFAETDEGQYTCGFAGSVEQSKECIEHFKSYPVDVWLNRILSKKSKNVV